MSPVAVSKDQKTPVANVPGIPFTAASHEHQEPAFSVVTAPLSGAAQQLNSINVPSFGYLRHIFLDINATVAAVGANTPREDFPWNLIQSLTLLDVNGAPIVGPIDGYALLWANIAGGYSFRNDPRNYPSFSANGLTPRFQLRVPVEIAHHNALGSIANQNAAAPYQLLITVNSTTGAYSAAPATSQATLTITGTLETWTLPSATDSQGRPQQQLPPAHGTGQFWSSRTNSTIAVGSNTIPLTRVGNLIRALIFICRNATPVRADGVFPDPVIINWDGRQLVNEPQNYRVQNMFEQLTNAARDTGVFVYPFNNSLLDRMGDESPNLWLPTVQATRLEVFGNAAVAGSVQIVTCDVQPIEVNPAARYQESNATSPTGGASGQPQNIQG